MQVDELKQAYRQKYRNKILQDKERKNKENQITNRIINLEEYEKCSEIYIYISKDNEVDTKNIINLSFKYNKKVAIPYCDNNCLKFFYIDSFEDVHKGRYNIYEPNTEYCQIAQQSVDTICIVPGICFDTKGYRLGHGKGLYDRFLCQFKGKCVGICFNSIVCDKIPIDKFDVSVDMIVTENMILDINKVTLNHKGGNNG